MEERRDKYGRHVRFERVKAELAERLRRVCAHMNEKEFDLLLERMATFHVKYTLRKSIDVFPEVDRGGK